jgi:SAM-dependent methyltransferase
MNYPFADRVAEDERLIAQARLFDPLTRRLLQQAGLASGMRVLDLGSGSGNVARLAAELVGPEGRASPPENRRARDPHIAVVRGPRYSVITARNRIGHPRSSIPRPRYVDGRSAPSRQSRRRFRCLICVAAAC